MEGWVWEGWEGAGGGGVGGLGGVSPGWVLAGGHVNGF